ncbi:MAG: hypothetical protein ACR5K4_03475 [Sodalis sp. (in: enterobacteria)]
MLNTMNTSQPLCFFFLPIYDNLNNMVKWVTPNRWVKGRVIGLALKRRIGLPPTGLSADAHK